MELEGVFVDETVGFVFESAAEVTETLLEAVENDSKIVVGDDLWVVVGVVPPPARGAAGAPSPRVVEDLWVVRVVETTDLVLEIELEVVDETLVDLKDGSDDISGPNLPPETPEVGETLSGANKAAFM